jgi:hypothetical protein
MHSLPKMTELSGALFSITVVAIAIAYTYAAMHWRKNVITCGSPTLNGEDKALGDTGYVH